MMYVFAQRPYFIFFAPLRLGVKTSDFAFFALRIPMTSEQATNYLRAADERMAALIERVGPCQLRRHDDLFVALVSSIMSQQLSTRAAATITARLIDRYAPAVFPSPEQILATPDEELRAIGCSRAKASYLKDLSARVVSGELDFERLREQDDEAIIAALVPVRGIGRWTAEMLLIFALGRLDVWPVDDLGIAVGVQRLYELPERPRPRELLPYGEPFRPYRSVASWYLWKI